jgi:hypothetical protein
MKFFTQVESDQDGSLRQKQITSRQINGDGVSEESRFVPANLKGQSLVLLNCF